LLIYEISKIFFIVYIYMCMTSLLVAVSINPYHFFISRS